MGTDPLLARSIKTLAWLGDAVYEREVRWRVAQRGDYPIDRLDAIKAQIVCAEAQSALLLEISPELTDPEHSVAKRALNTAGSAGRGRRSTQDYRRATGLEALVAHWALTQDAWPRFEQLVVPWLEKALDAAVARKAKRLKRG